MSGPQPPTDPQPLTDDELDLLTRQWASTRGPSWIARRLLATVHAVRAERDMYRRALAEEVDPCEPVDSTSEADAALRRTCPECGAKPSENCVVLDGDGERTGTVRWPHKIRRALDTGEAEEVCEGCDGSGVVMEQHDYVSEPLGCPDCMGTGKVPVHNRD